MKKIRSSAWKDIVLNQGELITHGFVTESVEQTQAYAQAFSSVANVQSRLYRKFRLGLHAPRPGFSSSGLGMSTFVKAFVERDTNNFKMYATGSFNQVIGYNKNLGVVNVQDNKADIFLPAVFSKFLNHIIPSLEIEEHAARGTRQFHAVIGFWDYKDKETGWFSENKRTLAIYSGEKLAETQSYQDFLNKVGAKRIELKPPKNF